MTTKYILGIDIGMKNYSYCIVSWTSHDEWFVKHWEVLDTNIKKTMGVVIVAKKMRDFLNKVFKKIDINISSAIIEAQPKKRLIMERILCNTVDYLINKDIDVHIRRSQDKFSIAINCPIYKGQSNYKKRKDLAIEVGYLCLKDDRNVYSHDTIIKWLDGFKKKDDLFDAFLLIMKFMNYSTLYK